MFFSFGIYSLLKLCHSFPAESIWYHTYRWKNKVPREEHLITSKLKNQCSSSLHHGLPKTRMLKPTIYNLKYLKRKKNKWRSAWSLYDSANNMIACVEKPWDKPWFNLMQSLWTKWCNLSVSLLIEKLFNILSKPNL